MKVDYATINKITYGVESIAEESGWFVFSRFTKDEEDVYKKNKASSLSIKTQATANVRFSFITDSKMIKFNYKMTEGTSRNYAHFDLYENGVLVYHEGTDSFNEDIMTFEFQLSKGKKHIELYFPWSVCVKITDFELDEGAYIEAVSRKGKMVCYGDSITQGYDAQFPSLSYSNQIARLLDMDSINKAIGGEIYFPQLLECATNSDADIVTVAYGTNDWRMCDYDTFVSNCKEFISKLLKLYTNSRIYVITPLWRKDGGEEVPMGIANSELDGIIRKICSEYTNVTVINGGELTPHDESFFWDNNLHPNDLGFSLYACNLYKIMSS